MDRRIDRYGLPALDIKQAMMFIITSETFNNLNTNILFSYLLYNVLDAANKPNKKVKFHSGLKKMVLFCMLVEKSTTNKFFSFLR